MVRFARSRLSSRSLTPSDYVVRSFARWCSIQTKRHVSSITITLSSLPLDTSNVGYQPPLDEEEIRSFHGAPCVRRLLRDCLATRSRTNSHAAEQKTRPKRSKRQKARSGAEAELEDDAGADGATSTSSTSTDEHAAATPPAALSDQSPSAPLPERGTTQPLSPLSRAAW